MNYLLYPFHKRLGRLRRERGWSLGDLSGATRIPKPRLSQLERGTRQPGQEEVLALAAAFCTTCDQLVRETTFGLAPTRRDLRDDNGRVSAWFGPLRDRVRIPDEKAWKRFSRAQRAYPQVMSRLWGKVATRADYPRVRAFLGYLRYDSCLEVLFITWLASCGAFPVLLSPRSLGFDQLPLFEGDPWRVLGHNLLPGLAMDLKEVRLVFFPQVQAKGYREAWTLDALTAVIVKGRAEWVDVEIDGSGHDHGRDLERTKDLGMVRIGFTEPDLQREGFSELLKLRILKRIRLQPRAA